MAILNTHSMTSATTVTKPSVHKARLTWQWRHLAHLLFDPDQGPLKRLEKFSRLIHSLITLLDHCWVSSGLLNTFSIVPQNHAARIAPLKPKGKVTKIKPYPYSFSLLHINHPCTVSSNQSLPHPLCSAKYITSFHPVPRASKEPSNCIKLSTLSSHSIQRRQISAEL